LRRIDRFSRLGLLGSHLALADAELPKRKIPAGHRHRQRLRGDGNHHAFLKSFINDGDICASPTYFANSVTTRGRPHLHQLGAMGQLTVTTLPVGLSASPPPAFGSRKEGSNGFSSERSTNCPN
jgi:3-oxoacyl-[acyl-carrier-protein] synthase II